MPLERCHPSRGVTPTHTEGLYRMTRAGYARVSTQEQDLSLQIARLTEAGCTRIYQEKYNGSTKDRPQLRVCLAQLQDGDTLCITRLDRLARSMLDLCLLIMDLEQRGVAFCVLEQHIDTSTATGKFQFHVVAAFAEFEKAIHKERQREGIAQAKARGLYQGRKPTLSRAQHRALLTQRTLGVPIKDLMKAFRLSKASCYRYLAQTLPAQAEAAG